MNLGKVLVIIGLAIGFGTMCYLIGVNTERNQTKDRALEIKAKDCYTQSDMDYIVFGESQL